MELTEDLKGMLIATAKELSGHVRRQCMARTVKMLGSGGASRAERELGWKRKTIRQGIHELESGMTCVDALSSRGRKRAEEHLPHLLTDMRAIVEGHSQTDPHCKANRLYPRLTAVEGRRHLIKKFGATDQEWPTASTSGSKLSEMGDHPMKVATSTPQKRAQPLMPSSSRETR